MRVNDANQGRRLEVIDLVGSCDSREFENNLERSSGLLVMYIATSSMVNVPIPPTTIPMIKKTPVRRFGFDTAASSVASKVSRYGKDSFLAFRVEGSLSLPRP